MNTLTQSLRSWAVQEVVADRRARMAVAALAFVLATSFGAQVAVRVPWTAIPFTLQPLFVILAGAVLGPRLGAGAIALYVALGATGAPVYSNGAGGIPWLFGPTGGYLLAMPAAAFVSGLIAGRDRGVVRTLIGLTLGVVTIYVGGVLQLLLLTGGSLPEVLAMGVFPFVTGDITKIVAACFLARFLKPTSLGRF